MNEIDVTPQVYAEVERLFDNFNLYAKGRTLADMIGEGAPLIAAMVTVERAQSRNDVTDVLHAMALGVYLAEIGQARLMLEKAVVQ